MNDRLRHPRLLAAFRVALYLTAGTVAVGVGVLAVSVVGFVAAVGTVAVVAGWSGLLPVVVLSLLVVATAGGLLGGLYLAARRVDREITAADRRPDPVQEAKRRYVEGRLDEAGLERRLERLLGIRGTAGPSTGHDSHDDPDYDDPDYDDRPDRTRHGSSPGRTRERASADGGD